MTYQPACLMAWKEMAAGMTDMSESRTVEKVLAELNQAKATLAEIEASPNPQCPMTEYRRLCAEWIAHRAIIEAQAMRDFKRAPNRAAQ